MSVGGVCVQEEKKKEHGHNYMKVSSKRLFAYCQSRKMSCAPFPADPDLTTYLGKKKTWSLDNYVAAHFLLLYTPEEEAAVFLLRTVAAIIQFLDDTQLVMGDGRLFEATHPAEIKGLQNILRGLLIALISSRVKVGRYL